MCLVAMKTTFLRRILLILALFLSNDYFALTQQISIPPSLKFCPKASPNIAACVKDSVEFLRPYLKSGDLGSGFLIHGLEPLDVDDVKLERGRGFFFHMTNIKAFKTSNFRIDKLRVNLNNLDFELLVEIPHLTAAGDYRINLVIGIANIKGQGKFNTEIENLRIRIKFKGTLYNQNGVQYMKFSHIDSKVQIPKITYQLHNLFKDKTLNEVSNNLINTNIHLFIDDIESSVQSSLTKTAYKSGNQIVQRIPFNVLFP